MRRSLQGQPGLWGAHPRGEGRSGAPGSGRDQGPPEQEEEGGFSSVWAWGTCSRPGAVRRRGSG